VSESGYHDWRSRPPSTRSLRHVWLTEQIQAVHSASFGTYGSRRVRAELRLASGIAVGHGAVELLMRRAGLAGLPGGGRVAGRCTTPRNRGACPTDGSAFLALRTSPRVHVEAGVMGA
jgi:putative transposase